MFSYLSSQLSFATMWKLFVAILSLTATGAVAEKRTECTVDFVTQYGSMFAIPGSCGKFLVCRAGKLEELSCPSGMLFDVGLSRCIGEHLAECLTENWFVPEGLCSSDGLAVHPDPHSCTRYVICLGEIALPGQCTPGLLFNSASLHCDDPHHSVCDISCPSEDIEQVYLPDSTGQDCARYYICKDGVPHPAECPSRMYFDLLTKTCVLPENASCRVDDVVCSDQDDWVENPKSCSSYYECERGFPHLRECGVGLDFFNEMCDTVSDDCEAFTDTTESEISTSTSEATTETPTVTEQSTTETSEGTVSTTESSTASDTTVVLTSTEEPSTVTSTEQPSTTASSTTESTTATQTEQSTTETSEVTTETSEATTESSTVTDATVTSTEEPSTVTPTDQSSTIETTSPSSTTESSTATQTEEPTTETSETTATATTTSTEEPSTTTPTDQSSTTESTTPSSTTDSSTATPTEQPTTETTETTITHSSTDSSTTSVTTTDSSTVTDSTEVSSTISPTTESSTVTVSTTETTISTDSTTSTEAQPTTTPDPSSTSTTDATETSTSTPITTSTEPAFTTTEHPPVDPAEVCRDEGIAVIPHPYNCYQYVVCIFGSGRVATCSDGQIFITQLLMCVPGDRDTCTATVEALEKVRN